MTVKITVDEFTVTADSLSEGSAKIARHFGTIADGLVQDSGLAIAHRAEIVEEN